MAAPREFSLTFEAAPPAAVRPGLPFTVPVIVAVRPIGTPSRTVQLVASASLRNEAGTSTAIGLGGNLTAMVRSRTEPSMSGYAKFAGLTISRPGKYRIRVMLSTSSVNGVMTKECVDSGVIHVHAAAPAAQRPSGSLSFLSLLSYPINPMTLHGSRPFVSTLLFPKAFLAAMDNAVVLGAFRDLGVFPPPIAVSGHLLMFRKTLAPTTVATLQRLTAENLDITVADIAKWQSA